MTDEAKLQRLADLWVAKYGEAWHFTVRDGAFHDPGVGNDDRIQEDEAWCLRLRRGRPSASARNRLANTVALSLKTGASGQVYSDRLRTCRFRQELEHAVEMLKLFGGGKGAGDIVGKPQWQLAILPGTSHIGVAERHDWLLSMVPALLDAPMPKV
jgi:hypothetical protein